MTKLLYAEPELRRALSRPLVFDPRHISHPEPHVIVQAMQVTPDYFGGGAEQVDLLLPLRTYNRLAARRAA